MNQTQHLCAISPLDGRYRSKVNILSEYFSEYGLIKHRLLVEVKYLEYFCHHVLLKPVSKVQHRHLAGLITHFDETEAARVKEIENITKHDVKAVEYYLREKLSQWPKLHPSIHFGLTSYDTNDCAHALMQQSGLNQVIIPKLQELIALLTHMADQSKSSPLLARTHGQAAVPTTMGKELFVFARRLNQELSHLRSLPIEAKLNGAVGNYNALAAAFPKVDWMNFSIQFLESLGLTPNLYTTQILPGDNPVKIFQSLHLINSILLGFVQDMWRYISDGYFTQKITQTEVGSSTMPHKVNPIDFENSEGNLGIANSLLGYFIDKFPISRLQRDLSDSTVKRNMGVALGHTLLSYSSCIAGLKKVSFDEGRARQDLDAHWEVVSEGIQTMLKTSGDSQAYEKLKTVSRGKQLTQETVSLYIDSLDVSTDMKQKLHLLSPHSYIGLAEKLVTQGIHTLNEKGK